MLRWFRQWREDRGHADWVLRRLSEQVERESDPDYVDTSKPFVGRTDYQRWLDGDVTTTDPRVFEAMAGPTPHYVEEVQ